MRDFEIPGRSTAYATHGMAATSHPEATRAAIEVLKRGGNAVDAAVTACAVQGVVEPQSTGIGGDCFCLYKPHDGDLVAFNGAGRAPRGASADIYADRGITSLEPHSAHAVTIPGAIDAWARLLSDHGTIGLGDALEPAIRLAREGYAVLPRVHFDWALYADLLRREPVAAEVFLPEGDAPAVGSRHRQPDLAESLAHIARNGADGFYTGRLAEAMVRHLNERGGFHDLDDFASAEGGYVRPIRMAFNGFDVYECPPPGQGAVALAMLNILSGLGLEALDPSSAERFHLEIETTRLAYRDRDRMLCDPAFAEVPVADWLSPEHAAARRARVDPGRAMQPPPTGDFPDHRDTVTIAVVDRWSNAVSLINSIFSPFGTGLVVPGTGILLHNRGRGFSLQPGHPNAIAPGKRPLHTIIPGMVMRDGRAVMPFGVMGGQYQACGHAHVLTNLLLYGMDPQQAVDHPRAFAVPGGVVEAERGLPDATRAGLEALGHELGAPERPIGGAQLVRIDWQNGVLAGASDGRKDGLALGY